MTISPRHALAVKHSAKESREPASGSAAKPASELTSLAAIQVELAEALDAFGPMIDPSLIRRVASEARSISALGAAIAANPEPVSPELVRSLQAEENWWRRIEKELPSLSSTDTAALLGASPTNRNFASAQRAAGKLIGYSRRHAFHYPEFQFDTSRGTVLPVIPRLLEVTRGLNVPDEDVVLWMAAPSSAFADQRRPVDHLDDPERLLAAAEAHFGAIW